MSACLYGPFECPASRSILIPAFFLRFHAKGRCRLRKRFAIQPSQGDIHSPAPENREYRLYHGRPFYAPATRAVRAQVADNRFLIPAPASCTCRRLPNPSDSRNVAINFSLQIIPDSSNKSRTYYRMLISLCWFAFRITSRTSRSVRRDPLRFRKSGNASFALAPRITWWCTRPRPPLRFLALAFLLQQQRFTPSPRRMIAAIVFASSSSSPSIARAERGVEQAMRYASSAPTIRAENSSSSPSANDLAANDQVELMRPYARRGNEISCPRSQCACPATRQHRAHHTRDRSSCDRRSATRDVVATPRRGHPVCSLGVALVVGELLLDIARREGFSPRR